MPDHAIEVENLVKIYNPDGNHPVRAVDGISFAVRRGEIFGLLGPNGAGKTTTLKILTTLLQPTSGSARLLGHDVVRSPLDVRKNICVVLQQDAVEQYLSVRNNFVIFGRFHGLSRKEIDLRCERVYDLFGLREYLDQKPIDLSGGLKRRVQVAKMFVVDKPIVFLDEATTGMDTLNKRATLDAIKEESRRGRTIILTTHMLDEAEELCTSMAIINHGIVIASGSTEEVKSKTPRLYYVRMSFKRMTETVVRALKRIPSVKLELQEKSAELTVKDQAVALQAAVKMKRSGLMENFEITSVSLEDVFVELLDKNRSVQP
jgi:ABC-2 type transport system ATP-binding protein